MHSQREFVQKFRRKIRVPVIGNIVRYFSNMFRMNRNIAGLISWNEEMERELESLYDRVAFLEEGRTNSDQRLMNLEENIRNNNTRLDDQQKGLRGLDMKLVNFQALLKMDSAKAQEGTDYFAIDYFDFENHFRGSREHVKEVQEIYLPYFDRKNHVLDLGCGRGEFVELLMEHQIGVKGVDLYMPYVQYCREKKLPVVHDDAIRFLKKQECVDGIFVGQVVEHISIEQIVELCSVAYDKLEKDCYLIMETPNPTSLAIYTNAFYIDPSHKKPVHPLTLQYIAEKQGFSDVQILFTESSRLSFEIPELAEGEEGKLHEFDVMMKHIQNVLFGSQDYAVIAKK